MKRNLTDGFVYFLTDGEAIKIGYTTNLRKRIRSLQGSHHFPLFLLGAIVGSMDDELLMHQKFSEFRLTGEWFKNVPQITETIDSFEDAGRFVDFDDFDVWEARVRGLRVDRELVTDTD